MFPTFVIDAIAEETRPLFSLKIQRETDNLILTQP